MSAQIAKLISIMLLLQTATIAVQSHPGVFVKQVTHFESLYGTNQAESRVTIDTIEKYLAGTAYHVWASGCQWDFEQEGVDSCRYGKQLQKIAPHVSAGLVKVLQTLVDEKGEISKEKESIFRQTWEMVTRELMNPELFWYFRQMKFGSSKSLLIEAKDHVKTGKDYPGGAQLLAEIKKGDSVFANFFAPLVQEDESISAKDSEVLITLYSNLRVTKD